MEWNYIIVLFIIFDGKERSIFHIFEAGDIDQAIDMKNRMEEHVKKNKLNEEFEIRFYNLRREFD